MFVCFLLILMVMEGLNYVVGFVSIILCYGFFSEMKPLILFQLLIAVFEMVN